MIAVATPVFVLSLPFIMLAYHSIFACVPACCMAVSPPLAAPTARLPVLTRVSDARLVARAWQLLPGNGSRAQALGGDFLLPYPEQVRRDGGWPRVHSGVRVAGTLAVCLVQRCACLAAHVICFGSRMSNAPCVDAWTTTTKCMSWAAWQTRCDRRVQSFACLSPALPTHRAVVAVL